MVQPRFATINAAFDYIASTASKWRADGDTSGRCRCPAHDGAKDANLKVTLADDRILFHCHSHGCSFESIVSGFGLGVSDVFKPGHRAVEAWEIGREKRADKNPPKHTAHAKRRARLLAEPEGTVADLGLPEPPVMIAGIVTALTMMRMEDQCAVGQLRAVSRSEEWEGLSHSERGLLADWMLAYAPRGWRGAVQQTLGTVREGAWRAAPPLPDAEPYERKTLADLTFEAPEVVAHGLAFRGRLGILHGPAGQGKTTLLANVASRITTGRQFAGRDVVAGDVVVYSEDLDSWNTVMHRAGGDRSRLVVLDRWPIPAEAIDENVALLVADTLAYTLHASGGDPDKSVDTDAIMRPLADIARKHNIAVVVLDHEPWASDSSEGKTVPRPKHSGAKVATADYVIRVSLTSSDSDADTLVKRGIKTRVGLDVPKAVVYDSNGAAVDGANLDPPDAEDPDWVFEYLEPEPASANQIRQRAGLPNSGANNNRVRAALESLAGEGAAVTRTLKLEGKPPSRKNPWLYAVTEQE